MPLVPPDLLAKLACPACHGPLVEREADSVLTCGACRLLYPVTDGIPALIAEAARPLDAEDR